MAIEDIVFHIFNSFAILVSKNHHSTHPYFLFNYLLVSQGVTFVKWIRSKFSDEEALVKKLICDYQENHSKLASTKSRYKGYMPQVYK